MHQLEFAEAQVFLSLNGLPKPGSLRKASELLEILATGGRGWIIGALMTPALRVRNSRRAVITICPVVALVVLAVEGVAKRLLVRHRSFRHAVAMMLLGVRPRRHSFPSGHAAASWAGAWLFGRLWPDGRNGFLGIAAVVSVSRVYLGAHGPGDVIVGSIIGLALAEALRRPLEHLGRIIGVLDD
jgi:undecaprenyl-diphosphatase